MGEIVEPDESKDSAENVEETSDDDTYPLETSDDETYEDGDHVEITVMTTDEKKRMRSDGGKRRIYRSDDETSDFNWSDWDMGCHGQTLCNII
jgi:hypothetical protein